MRGEERREEEKKKGGWQCGRVVLITPYVWTGEGGVEVLFQLINRDTVLLRSLCLLLPPPSASPIRDNVSGIDTAGSGFYDRNTVVLREAHVKNSVVDRSA